MPRPGSGKVFVTAGPGSAFLGRQMKVSAIRAGGVLTALVLALITLPGPSAQAAADPQLSLTVAMRWGATSTQGIWTPYVVNLKNEGGADFAGDLFLVPNEYRSDFRSSSAATYPTYRAHVVVPRSSERSQIFYVVDAPNGYVAQARDSGGRVLARAELAGPAQGSSALGVLSDLPQAEPKISAPLRAVTRLDSSLARFSSPQSFPTNAVFLTGLNGIVIDQFDSASLSQAQIQALKDYVGLGGTLIVAGGPSWRRTLLPLPTELVPLRPVATATASLAPLAELGGRATDASAQVVTGELRAGKVALSGADGVPLLVEAAYGAGTIVQLAFDPFGEPFDGQVSLAGLAWAQAIDRAVSAVQSGLRPNAGGSYAGTSSTPSAGAVLAAPGVWAPGYGASSDQLFQVLQDTPAAGSPPVGLLGGLLVSYVLLAGVLNYLFLKAIRRRGLMWLTTPLIAITFTAGAYLAGFGSRGSDFYVTQVQVQRLAPDGAVQTYAFDGVFAPRKGDVHVGVPSNSLVSTAVSSSSFGDAGGNSLVTVGSRPEVEFTGVAVWSMKALQTLSVTHPYAYDNRQQMPLEAHMRLENGRVKGTVVNHGPRPITDLKLAGGNSAQATVAASVSPGAAVNVDVDLSQSRLPTVMTQALGDSKQTIRSGPRGARDAVIRIAATQALSGRPGELALVGLTDANQPLVIEGGRPSHAAITAVVEPVALEAADAVGGASARPRLVSSFLGDGASQLDVYDFQLPTGVKSSVGLGYSFVDAIQTPVRSVEVFDWANRSWRPLRPQAISSSRAGTTALGAGEVSTGTVRVRVRESEPGQASLALNDG